MKRKITLLLTLIISLGLFSQERIEKRKSNITIQKTTIQYINNVSQPSRTFGEKSILLSEGFDASFLPEGWTQKVLNSSYTWVQANLSEPSLNFNTIDPSSLYSAMVNWDLAMQSEWLYSPQINPNGMSSVELQFYAGISGLDLANATLKCLITIDDGQSWDILWDAIDHVASEDPWEWRLVTIDLSVYAAEQFKIAWLYIGSDGNTVGVDGVIITAEAVSVTANFSANQTSIVTGQSVQFTNSSVGSTSWEWEFEGGTPSTSTQQNPSVTYNTAGTYNVKLTAKNGSNQDVELKNNYISVSSEITANFSANQTNIITGQSVQFTNSSAGATSWEWEFDGGTPSTSTQQNPSVTYNTTGTYNVKLTAKNGSNQDVELKSNYISVSSEITASFSANQTNIVTEQSVQFTNSSAGSTSWEWEFEGGTPSTSTQQNPVIKYNTEGTFNVKLTAKNGSSEDVELKNDYIKVSASGGELQVDVVTDPGTSICKYESLSLTATATGGTGSYQYTWDINSQSFSGSTLNIYSLVESTNIYLTVSSGIQESNTTIPITVNSIPPASIVGKGSPERMLICPNPDLQYQWYVNQTPITNAKKQFYYPGEGVSLSGIYYVVTTTEAGCDSTSVKHTVIDSKSLYNNSQAGIISAYPNPSNGTFSIDLNPELVISEINKYSIELLSIAGNKVWETNFISDFTIDFAPDIKLSSGIYIIKLYGDNELLDTQKLLVN